MILQGLSKNEQKGKYELELRYPLPEDSFRGGKLSEYLRMRKVPLHQRDRVLILVRRGSKSVLGLFMPMPSEEVVIAKEYEEKGQDQDGGSALTLEIID